MILFIVVGRKREPLLLKAINSLFLKNGLMDEINGRISVS
jgi:hypothetical protein